MLYPGNTMNPVSHKLHLMSSPNGEFLVITINSLESANPCSVCVSSGMGNFTMHLYCRLRLLASSRFIALWKPEMWLFTVVMESSNDVKITHPSPWQFQMGLNDSKDRKYGCLIMVLIKTNQNFSFVRYLCYSCGT